MRFEIFYFSDKGPRIENQDSLEIKASIDHLVACIADGVGGSNCGSIASKESVAQFMRELLSDNFDFNLEQVIKNIDKYLNSIQSERSECKGMATTFTGYVVVENYLRGIHIGDTRLCILRGNGLKQLTEDHTEVHALVKAGRISPEEAKNYPRRHVLERALKGDGVLDCQLFEFNLENRDRILITTDGVHEVVSKVELRDLSVNAKTVQSFGSALLDRLRSKRLTDNYSFVVAELIR